MSDAVFLAFDCETGGIGENISLLSVYFAVCDSKWNILDDLMIYLQPEETDDKGCPVYRVTAEAMAINKIDLQKHAKDAISKSKAGGLLREFLWKYKPAKGWLMPMGKNVGGDADWVQEHILNKKEWGKVVSYRMYDITGIITYLKRLGKLAPDAPEGLCELAEYLGISFEHHTADGDTKAGIEVMKVLEALGVSTNDKM